MNPDQIRFLSYSNQEVNGVLNPDKKKNWKFRKKININGHIYLRDNIYYFFATHSSFEKHCLIIYF